MDIPTGGIFDFRDGTVVRWQDSGSKKKALERPGLRTQAMSQEVVGAHWHCSMPSTGAMLTRS
jgi:hypothetical protein